MPSPTEQNVRQPMSVEAVQVVPSLPHPYHPIRSSLKRKADAIAPLDGFPSKALKVSESMIPGEGDAPNDYSSARSEDRDTRALRSRQPLSDPLPPEGLQSSQPNMAAPILGAPLSHLPTALSYPQPPHDMSPPPPIDRDHQSRLLPPIQSLINMSDLGPRSPHNSATHISGPTPSMRPDLEPSRSRQPGERVLIPPSDARVRHSGGPLSSSPTSASSQSPTAPGPRHLASYGSNKHTSGITSALPDPSSTKPSPASPTVTNGMPVSPAYAPLAPRTEPSSASAPYPYNPQPPPAGYRPHRGAPQPQQPLQNEPPPSTYPGPSGSMAVSNSEGMPTSLPSVESPTAWPPRQHEHHHYIAPASGAFANQMADRYVCPICSKAFSRPSSLRIHSHSHTGEKPFVCPHQGCGKAFSVRSNMRRHERGCHGGSAGGSGTGENSSSSTGSAAPSITPPASVSSNRLSRDSASDQSTLLPMTPQTDSTPRAPLQ